MASSDNTTVTFSTDQLETIDMLGQENVIPFVRRRAFLSCSRGCADEHHCANDRDSTFFSGARSSGQGEVHSFWAMAQPYAMRI